MAKLGAALGPWEVDGVDARRLELIAEGYSASAIARRLNDEFAGKLPREITRNAVISRGHRKGQRIGGLRGNVRRNPPKPPPERRERSHFQGATHDRTKATKPKVHKPDPPPVPRPEAIAYDRARLDAGLVTLEDMESHQCRFPISHRPLDPPLGFCGAPQVPGLSYCQHHAKRCNVPHSALSRPASARKRIMEPT